MGGVPGARDIDGQVGVEIITIGKEALQFGKRDLLAINVDLSKLAVLSSE